MSEGRAYRDVDVIIPVYRDVDVTRRCIASVLASDLGSWVNIVVIDDSSPDENVRGYCDSLRGQARLTVLRNTENKGFVATVNIGMQLNRSHDVLLLNSDTEVAGDWLARLQACAYRKPRTGTVTPFSNNATICSYPKFVESNELPAGYDVTRLHQCFATANEGLQHALPTAVGFCMYIRRDCLAEVGYFDEASFGKGYGEECDFSMRASAEGWTNQLATDVFVYHEGGVSFGKETQTRKIAAEAAMLRKHPNYTKQITDFIARDPLQSYRKAVDEIRERGSDGLVKVAVCLAAYNGMRWIPELVASVLAQTGVSVFLFISVDESTDNTAAWAQQQASKFSNVTLLPERKETASSSHNFFRLCRDVNFVAFDYVAFADQDDNWLPNRLVRAVIKLKETNCEGYSSNVIATWESTGKTSLIDKAQPQVAWDFLFESPGPGCTFVFTQALALELQLFLEKNKIITSRINSHDWFVYAYARTKGYKWHIDSQATVLYRQHDHNVFGANRGLRAWIQRWEAIKDQSWITQISYIIEALDLNEAPFVKRWYPFSRRGFLYLASHARQCRRRRRDKILFSVISLYWAIRGKS